MALHTRKYQPHRDMLSEFMAHITSRGDSTFQGVLEHSHSRQKQAFRSLLEMFMLIQSKVQETGNPHPVMKLRSWHKGTSKTPYPASKKEEASLPETELQQTVTKIGGQSFFIRIMFNQNATYQGEISWLEGQKSLYFRSFLELTMLIQEALATAGVATDDVFHSWKEEELVY